LATQSTDVLNMIVKVLRSASMLICMIVIASFVVFAVVQTKTASAHQQEELKGAPITRTSTNGRPVTPPGQAPGPKGTVHKTLDEVSETFTSPFAGVVSGSDSEWTTEGVKLILALLVYGFGLGYLARILRVRV
jgi:hypothetical protein